MPFVIGTLSGPNGARLPPNAQVLVRIEDISNKRAPKLIADQVIQPAGQFPIGYCVVYEADDIEVGNYYGIVAQAFAGDRMIYRSTRPEPVVTRGAPSKRDVVLEPVED